MLSSVLSPWGRHGNYCTEYEMARPRLVPLGASWKHPIAADRAFRSPCPLGGVMETFLPAQAGNPTYLSPWGRHGNPYGGFAEECLHLSPWGRHGNKSEVVSTVQGNLSPWGRHGNQGWRISEALAQPAPQGASWKLGCHVHVLLFGLPLGGVMETLCCCLPMIGKSFAPVRHGNGKGMPPPERQVPCP